MGVVQRFLLDLAGHVHGFTAVCAEVHRTSRVAKIRVGVEPMRLGANTFVQPYSHRNEFHRAVYTEGVFLKGKQRGPRIHDRPAIPTDVLLL